MIDLTSYVSSLVLEHLSDYEKAYLIEIFHRFGGYPTLEQLWQLMDEPWLDLGCDPQNLDERVFRFYQHPVWLLNGLFIEQDEQSLRNRQGFADWVVQQQPHRVADFGGGFGGLARFIGQALPSAHIEIVEPHPHPSAIALADNTPNVRFVPELIGEYDLLIATDVFEHVSNPIDLAANTANHLRIDGQYLIANCFQPVILCHLPQLFHLNYAWDAAMKAMGLEPDETVLYGRAYRRVKNLDVTAAHQIENRARGLYPWIQKLPIPRGKTRLGRLLVKAMSVG